ncbi:hypothetical protein [Klebsiella pneumoniae]|uniref:hypothetical protein n=1 Tax=Klebsiella pneumoniae TaxID=573 RepID=UPI003D2ACA62
MNFASFLREDQRLVMLRFLSEMPSYSSNSSVIYQALTRYGPLAVFAPGTHTAMDGRTITFTPEDCIDLANSYDPSVSEAPFVIGHPSLTAPAYGWAERLEFRDGIVYAAPRQVNPAFAEAFNAGSYKKRSLSIYQPDSPGNPKPGHFYARHVGFLGAVPPGVKGLPDAQFAEASGDNGPLEFALPWEADNLASLFQSIRDWVIQETTIEQADSIIPQWRIQSILDSATDDRKSSISPLAYAEETNVDPNKKTPSTATDFAEREAALAAREAKLAADEEVARTRQLEENALPLWRLPMVWLRAVAFFRARKQPLSKC